MGRALTTHHLWRGLRHRAVLAAGLAIPIAAATLPVTSPGLRPVDSRGVQSASTVGQCPPGSQGNEPTIISGNPAPTLVAGPNGTLVFTVHYTDETALDATDVGVAINGGTPFLFGSASATIAGNPGDLNPAYPDPANHGAYTVVSSSPLPDWSLGAPGGAVLDVAGNWTWGHEKDIIGHETPGSMATVSYTFPAPTTSTVDVTISMQDGDFCGDAASATVHFTNPTPPALSVTKTADAPTVSSGDALGFTVTVKNTSSTAATAVVVNDPLPPATGVSWAIAPAYAGPGSCSIGGAPPSQTLTCSLGTLAGGASASVHIASASSGSTTGTLVNTASASGGNTGQTTGTARITVNPPALSVTKTADAASVSSGTDIGFTISVANSGAGVARAVSISDPLPAATGVSWSISPAYAGPGSCTVTGTAPSQSLSCALGDLGPGATAGVHLTSHTTGGTSGTLSNTATVSATNSGSSSSTATVTVLQPGLQISKTADAATVDAGSPVGFTVTVTNSGPGAASAVVVNDPLPAAPGISWAVSPAYGGPGSCSITGSAPSQTLGCQLGTLAAGATASVHVGSGTTVAVGRLSNTATVSASNAPTATSTASTTVVGPTLDISKTADSLMVPAGSPIGFTITVSNSGQGAATGVHVTDSLPASTGLAWSVSPAVSGCAIGAGTLTCNLGTLGAGASVAVHITSPTTTATCGSVSNSATASATNAAGSVTSPTVSVAVQCAALAITKVADMSPIVASGQAGYTIAVTDTGAGTATNVVVTDSLPAGLTWTATPASGTCSISGQSLTCTIPTLAAGATTTIHLTAMTTGANCGTIVNTASASASNAGQVTTPPASITVTCAVLTVTKTACPTTVVPGGYLTYTIAVSDGGTADAPGATIVDQLPAGEQLVSSSGGTYDAATNTVTWVADVDKGHTTTETLTVLVTAASGTTLTNTATASDPTAMAAAMGVVATPVSNAGAVTHGSAYSADVSALGLNVVHQLGAVSTQAPGGPAAAESVPGVLSVPNVSLQVLDNTSQSALTTQASSTSTTTVLGASLLGGLIKADVLHGVSQSTAGALTASDDSTGTTFQNLVIQGTTLTNVAPNTHVSISVPAILPLLPPIKIADVVLYEQTGTAAQATTGGFSTASNSVNLIDITLDVPLAGLPLGARIVVGHVQTDATYPSGLACGTNPRSVSGRAIAAQVTAGVGGIVVSGQQGSATLAPTGGSASDSTTVNLPNAASAAAAADTTSGSLQPTPSSTADSQIAGANVLNGLVTADVLHSTAASHATGVTAGTVLGATFVNLKVAGAPVAIAPTPNTVITVSLPGSLTLVVILDEQVTTTDGHSNTDGTVNAIHATLFNANGTINADVIVASAHSDAHI